MDYIKLARELRGAKRLLVKAKKLNKITYIENGENFVLEYLSKNGGSLNPKQISSALSVSSARIAAIVNQLETKGFVERDVDSDDSRQTIIRLMPKGIRQQKENESAYEALIVKFLKALGPEDARDYVRIQKRIADIFGDKKDDHSEVL